MEKLAEKIGLLIAGLMLVVFAVIFGAFITQWGWNNFMTSVLGYQNITFTEALALSLLISGLKSKREPIKLK